MIKIGCYGCTKLEYLESTGTQYIDTGVIPSLTFKSIIDFETKSITTEQQVLGMQEKNSSRLYVAAWHASKFYFGYGDWYYSNNTISPNTRYKIESDFRNGVQKHYFSEQLIDEKNLTINSQWDSSMYLFARNLSLKSKVDLFASIKLYRCQIYNNETLVRDYIPVLDSNDRPCLFDKVSKTCFYNQGTGEFLYG